MKTTIYKLAAILIALCSMCGFPSTTFAQSDRTSYFLDCIPQSSYSNPANMPDAKYYIGIPALSSFYLSFENTGFTFSDIISKRSDDSLEITQDDFLNALSDKNSLALGQSEEIMAFGFKAKKNYITFSISERLSTNFKYPKSLFELLLKGNSQYIGDEVSFEGIGLNLNLYVETALGFSRKINDKLTVGTRLKYLTGVMNLWTEKADLRLYTGTVEEAYMMRVTSDILIHTSAPGTIEDIDFSSGLSKNTGFAVDIGGKYKLNNHFTFSASILDFGSIKWKEGVENFVSKQANSSFSFEGFDINDFVGGGEISDSIFEEILDSLTETLSLDTTFTAYRAPLVTVFNLAALYSLTPRDRFGALIRGKISSTGLDPSLTLSYQRAFGRIWNLAVSYTAKNKSYMNLGLATVFNLGAYQLYFLTDNFYSVIAPTKSKMVNFRFGMNVTIGREKPPRTFTPVVLTPADNTPPPPPPPPEEPKE